MADLLSDDAIHALIEILDGWDHKGDGIEKTYVFDDFVAAFGWMASVALTAERVNHHPEWRNVYRTVEVRLSTHDAGGITQLDLDLAAAMDRLAG